MADGRTPAEDLKKIDEELGKYSPELMSRPQIVVANKCDSADMDSDSAAAFKKRVAELGRDVVYVSAVTGEGLDELVSAAAEALRDLPPLTVYEPEYTAEDAVKVTEADVRATTVRRENEKYVVEGEWLFNFMGNINFSDYESLMPRD